MKKTMFFLAAGAMALTACTQSDVLEEGIQSNAIGFQNMVSKESRALDKASLNRFYVYAYYTPSVESGSGDPVLVFSGDAVTLSGTEWGYTNTRYWIPGADYTFYAYSAENGALKNGSAVMNLDGTTSAARALRLNGYECRDGLQEDLIFATTTQKGVAASADAANPANKKVALTFKHVLSRVNVKFASDFASGYEIKVSEVSITNLRDKGNFSAATNSWSQQSRTIQEDEAEGNVGAAVTFAGFVEDKNIASKGDGTEANPDLTATTTNCFVLPYSYTTDGDVKLRFKIEVIDTASDQTILTRDMVGSWAPNWVAGTSYTYNVKISGTVADLEPIVFETQENMNVDDWTTGSTTSVEMNFSAN